MDEEDDGGRTGKPTPVRASLKEPGGQQGDVRLPGRSLTWDGEEWWAQELGRTRLGPREDGTGEMTLVGFRPADSEGDGFQREALLAGPGLEAIEDARLLDALATAGPFRKARDEPKPFFGGTGGRRGGGAGAGRSRSGGGPRRGGGRGRDASRGRRRGGGSRDG